MGACTIDPRTVQGTGTSARSDAGISRPLADDAGQGAAGGGPGTGEGPPDIGGIDSPDNLANPGMVNGAMSADAGSAGSGATGGASACTPTGPRDCTSDLDNDCDGLPDNTLDDVCVCAPESSEPCEAHPGLDGRGPCRAGLRSCVLGAANGSSSWGACEGSVGPAEQDSCTIAGDDANCDGTNNGGCPCIEGETRPCGPEADVGICRRGTQACVGGSFGACEAAVFPAARDCSSAQDNDCDGLPDNSIDSVCMCRIGASQACGAHPGRDGNGRCRAGSQTCQGGTGDETSGFGVCVGSVGPAPQDTCEEDDDSNCNGIVNEGCACVNGQTRACGPDTELGICQRGLQTCAGGAFGQCVGAVFPAPRDCDSPGDNDCDGRPDDTFDDVCLAPQNPFTCSNANPPPTVLPFSLFPVDPQTGGGIFPAGNPPAATGGSIQNGRYEPTRMEVYGQAEVPTFGVNELTFEFRDGFVQVGYQAFLGTGAVLGSGELTFVGSATPQGNTLAMDVDICVSAEPCSVSGTTTCAVPTSLPYSAIAGGLVIIQPAPDGSTVVTTYSRQ